MHFIERVKFKLPNFDIMGLYSLRNHVKAMVGKSELTKKVKQLINRLCENY